MALPPPTPLLDSEPVFPVRPRLRSRRDRGLANPLGAVSLLDSVARLQALEARRHQVVLEVFRRAGSLEALLRDSLDVVDRLEGPVSYGLFACSYRWLTLLGGFAPPPGFAPQGAPRKYSPSIRWTSTDDCCSGRVSTSPRIPAPGPRTRVPSARIWRTVMRSAWVCLISTSRFVIKSRWI